MNIHQIVALLLIAALAAIAGYRAESKGWILIAGLPAVLVGFAWAVSLVLFLGAWCLESPFSAVMAPVCTVLSAAFVPWYVGTRIGRLPRKN